MKRFTSLTSCSLKFVALRFAGHFRGFENDPFGEKRGWDHDLYVGHWADINIDKLSEAVDSNAVQHTHFGPDCHRSGTVLRAAFQHMNKGSTNATSNESAGPTPLEEITDSYMPEEAEEQDNPLTLEEALMMDKSSQAPDLPEFVKALRETNAPRGQEVASRRTDPRDPLNWSTDEVIEWLRKYTNIDDSAEEAFRIARVTGKMLLDTVQPPDLFREMRKWHLKGRSTKPNVSEEVIQATLIGCFPYGPTCS